MNAAKVYSLAAALLSVAVLSHPTSPVRADELVTAQRSGCSHLRYFAVPIAARDGAQLFANDLNNKGEVVGNFSREGTVEAFLWKDGRYVALGDRILAGALQTTASAINDRTQVIGDLVAPDFSQPAYLLDRRGVTYLIDLFSVPQEINDRGEIASMAISDGLLHGAVWRNGETVLLPMAPGHVSVNTKDINNKGTVVGSGGGTEGNAEALVWFAPYTTAPTVIPLPPDAVSSPGVDGVNNRDQVIFSVGLASGFTRGYVWSADRPLRVLEPLPGFVHSVASDINTAGLIVGLSVAESGESTTATVWRGGQTCELGDLVRRPGQGRWINASRVNERGEILAFLSPSPVGAGWFVLRPRD